MIPEGQFVKDIETELVKEAHFGPREEVFFELRFEADRPLDYQHKQIAEELMRKDSRLAQENYSSSINTTCKNVVAAMVNVYGKEMKADEVDVEKIVGCKKGERGAWKVVYRWLWECKFPRRQVDGFWQLLRENADLTSEWMRFFTDEEMVGVDRGMVFDRPPQSQEKTPRKLPVKTPLLMSMDFAGSDRYLLLLNRGLNTRFLVCPSLAFAPSDRVVEMPVWLPQKGAWMEEKKISFDGPGEEEYLAILLEKPLEIEWLQPKEEDPFPSCNGRRMMELWQQLEGQTNWRAYYQKFEVVE